MFEKSHTNTAAHEPAVFKNCTEYLLIAKLGLTAALL